MISPASFNYYLECLARAEELKLKAQVIPKYEHTYKDLITRSRILLREVPKILIIGEPN